MKKKASILLLKWGTKGGIETVGADIARVLLELDYEVTICAKYQLKTSERLKDSDLRYKRLFPRSNFMRRIWFRLFARYLNRYLLSSFCRDTDIVVVTHIDLLPDCIRIKDARILLWLHGIEAWGRSHYINQYAGIIDKLICVSNFTQQQLGEGLRVPSTVIYNAVDTEHFKAISVTEHSGGINILTCGRIVKGRPKGHRTLIKAARILMDQKVDFDKIYIVGDGDDRQRLEAIACAVGLRHKIDFVGEVTDDVLLSYYQQSDIFVLLAETSLDPQKLYGEGLGIVCLEAAAFGLPVITSDYGGTAETVIDQQTGFLLPCADADQCADRLKSLILDGDLRRKFGTAARELAVERFSYPKFKRSLSGLL